MRAIDRDIKICVIGLGYVGLPLAVSLSEYFETTGLDVNETRVSEIKEGVDSTREVGPDVLKKSNLIVTNDVDDIKKCNFYIVTVPTPVDDQNKPDLICLQKASETIGKILKKDDIVVYESTVYPGVTEDFCGSILENCSGLVAGKDFFLGYSPERINPGDKSHILSEMTKIISADNAEIVEILFHVYGKICKDIFIAKSIKVAEAAKVIENSQRDINIAFINEVTMIMNKLGISVYDVLEAAKTKWNFLDFTPGFVGGHCIGVDPYYLSTCAQDVGCKPRVILSGRETNESMGFYIAEKIHDFLKKLLGKKKVKILILGLAFKENVPDLRNTKVIDLVKDLKQKNYDVDVYDPLVSTEQANDFYNIELLEKLNSDIKYDCIVGAVSHDVFKKLSILDFEEQLQDGGVIIDLKKMWPDFSDSNFVYWTL